MSEKLNVLLEFYLNNDRMIETVERVNDSYLEMLDALDVLEDENAKLRELVADMLNCIEIRAAFGRPPTSEMYERFADAARELGVEVDG